MLPKFAATLLLFVLFFGLGSSALGQNDTDTKPEMAQKDSGDNQVKEPITIKAVDALIKEKKFDLATKMLDTGIANAGSDGLKRLRYSLALGLGRAREYDKAYAQGEQYIRALIERDSYSAVSPAFSALIRVIDYGNRSDQTGSATKLAMDTLAKAKQVINDDSTKYIGVMQSLVPVCASQLSKNNKEESAEKLLTETIAKLDTLRPKDGPEIDYLIAKTKLLKSRVSLPHSTKESAAELKKFIDESNAIHPDSIPLLASYMRAETFMIGEMLNNYPHEAKKRIAALRELVGARTSETAVLRSMPGTVKSLDSLTDDALGLLKLVGTKAAAFEADAWINGSEQSLESLKGKVVLLDFWAVWCGPCIAAFPHLEELHDEFKDDGLAIIGVTSLYNYRWNAEKQRAFHAEDEVPKDEEIADTEKFVQHYKLQYPVIITPESGTMLKNYEAFAFPHVVIIDQEGKIQLARVGAGRGAFDQIHDKIKELLEKK